PIACYGESDGVWYYLCTCCIGGTASGQVQSTSDHYIQPPVDCADTGNCIPTGDSGVGVPIGPLAYASTPPSNPIMITWNDHFKNGPKYSTNTTPGFNKKDGVLLNPIYINRYADPSGGYNKGGAIFLDLYLPRYNTVLSVARQLKSGDI